MYLSKLSYKKIKKRYLQFLKSQEVMSEPFRDKVGQLNNFYLPISLNINKYYKTKKKTLIIGLTGSQGSGTRIEFSSHEGKVEDTTTSS